MGNGRRGEARTIEQYIELLSCFSIELMMSNESCLFSCKMTERELDWGPQCIHSVVLEQRGVDMKVPEVNAVPSACKEYQPQNIDPYKNTPRISDFPQINALIWLILWRGCTV